MARRKGDFSENVSINWYNIHVSSLSRIPLGLKFPACSVHINEDVGGGGIVVELLFRFLLPLSRNSIVTGVPPTPSIPSSAAAGLGPASYKTIPITMHRKAMQKYGVNRKPTVSMSKNAANKSLVSRRMFSRALRRNNNEYVYGRRNKK